uniref:Uncharacterized protein n=1 Tax=Romanomermis culicivorax TaxID=13658 RepID=A0A915JAU6_ROMCU
MSGCSGFLATGDADGGSMAKTASATTFKPSNVSRPVGEISASSNKKPFIPLSDGRSSNKNQGICNINRIAFDRVPERVYENLTIRMQRYERPETRSPGRQIVPNGCRFRFREGVQTGILVFALIVARSGLTPTKVEISILNKNFSTFLRIEESLRKIPCSNFPDTNQSAKECFTHEANLGQKKEKFEKV